MDRRVHQVDLAEREDTSAVHGRAVADRRFDEGETGRGGADVGRSAIAGERISTRQREASEGAVAAGDVEYANVAGIVAIAIAGDRDVSLAVAVHVAVDGDVPGEDQLLRKTDGRAGEGGV